MTVEKAVEGQPSSDARPGTGGLSRRSFLGTAWLAGLGFAAAAVSAGCTAGRGDRGAQADGGPGTATGTATTTTRAGAAGAGSSPPPDPDVTLALAAADDEAAVRDFCLAAMLAQPALRHTLQPIRVRQHDHVEALRGAVSDITTATPPTASGPSTPVVPRRAPQVLDELMRLLATAERQRLDDCLAARSGLLARLLASTSASHAATLAVLRQAT